MPLIILFVIISVPYLEFLVFVEVANEVGGITALMLTLLTAFLGIFIIRREGLQVVSSLKSTVDRGESPVKEIIHGFFLAIAGIFFLLPGFITDTIALLLAIGPIRSVLGELIVKSRLNSYKNRPRSSYSETIIIEGEYEESDTNTDETDKQINDKNKNK